MNQSWGGQSGSKSSNPKIQSFLEALRSSQGKVNPPGGESLGSNPFSEFQQKKEIEKRRIESFQRARTEEWNRVFSAKQRETERKIEQIRQELKNLANQLKNLDANITKAVQSPVIEAGEYHLSFLDHLRDVLHFYSLKASSANSWLEMYNHRSKKQGHYWAQASKKGTSFTLNNERTVATSVG